MQQAIHAVRAAPNNSTIELFWELCVNMLDKTVCKIGHEGAQAIYSSRPGSVR